MRWGYTGCSYDSASDELLPGQYFDQETELHYNWHRYYDPTTGRYITADPVGILRDYSDPRLQVAIEIGALEETGFAGEVLNHSYGYVGQNPLFWTDLYGFGRKENGGSGSSSGVGTSNPYKHCKEDPNDPTKIICKDKKSGKKITKPKPADWNDYKSESCGDNCQATAIGLGLGCAVAACVLFPEVCLPAVAIGGLLAQ